MVLEFEQRNPVKWMRTKENTIEFKYTKQSYFNQVIRNYYILKNNEIPTPKLVTVDENILSLEFQKINGLQYIDVYNNNIIALLDRLHKAANVENKIDQSWLNARLPIHFINEDILIDRHDCFIHSDPSRANFIHVAKDIYIIDIDDCIMGPREFDYAKVFFDQYTKRDFSLYERFLYDAKIGNEELFLVCAQWQTLFGYYFIQKFYRPIIKQLKHNAQFINQKLENLGLATQDFHKQS